MINQIYSTTLSSIHLVRVSNIVFSFKKSKWSHKTSDQIYDHNHTSFGLPPSTVITLVNVVHTFIFTMDWLFAYYLLNLSNTAQMTGRPTLTNRGWKLLSRGSNQYAILDTRISVLRLFSITFRVPPTPGFWNRVDWKTLVKKKSPWIAKLRR